MTAASAIIDHVVHEEPVGLVVQDGGENHRPPRIRMYFWANQEETDEVERSVR